MKRADWKYFYIKYKQNIAHKQTLQKYLLQQDIWDQVKLGNIV